MPPGGPRSGAAGVWPPGLASGISPAGSAAAHAAPPSRSGLRGASSSASARPQRLAAQVLERGQPVGAALPVWKSKKVFFTTSCGTGATASGSLVLAVDGCASGGNCWTAWGTGAAACCGAGAHCAEAAACAAPLATWCQAAAWTGWPNPSGARKSCGAGGRCEAAVAGALLPISWCSAAVWTAWLSPPGACESSCCLAWLWLAAAALAIAFLKIRSSGTSPNSDTPSGRARNSSLLCA
mmetsp:Transcript_116367/g.324252  ORF Transcript_116367/g.324252 Transcript_116367/m.324252 type:complete len:239 (-) Transcript_116367:364-1080(-)